MPEISVIIPTYNRAYCIRETLESVYRQSFQNFEVIIVDDASTDQTKEILRHDAEANHLIYIEHLRNKGIAAARNTGIRNSTGKYLAFLDSDDCWLPDKLKLQYENFENNPKNLGLVYTGMACKYRGSDTISYPSQRALSGYVFEKLLEENMIIPTSSVMIKRKCIDKIGLFEERMPCMDDWDMWLRVAKEYEVDFLPNILTIYILQQDNVSTDSGSIRRIAAREIFLLKHQKNYYDHLELYSKHFYILGIQCYKKNLMKRGRNHFLSALRHSSGNDGIFFKFRCVLQVIVSFAGGNAYSQIRKLADFMMK